jgi:peptidoglycan/xylan/chitin deacetylase (PgdA/CDA1 family)
LETEFAAALPVIWRRAVSAEGGFGMLDMAQSLAGRAMRKLAKLGKRRISSAWPKGVVSFTFDDFPKTALLHGGAILERYGARGTYYAAFGLAGSEDALGEMFDCDDVRSAHIRGHEIASHTFSHCDCTRLEAKRLRAEVRDNARAMAPILEGWPMASFSYPFGAVSTQARTVLAPCFSSCRGIQPGINEQVPDYADLRANKIYAAEFDSTRVKDLIARNSAVGGWLIFYTHDVRASPSAFGCTPAQLDSVVEYAARRATILPVGDVVSRLGRLAVYRQVGAMAASRTTVRSIRQREGATQTPVAWAPQPSPKVSPF